MSWHLWRIQQDISAAFGKGEKEVSKSFEENGATNFEHVRKARYAGNME